MDDRGEGSGVESLLQLKSTTFHQGEKVLAYRTSGVHEAKVLQVDSRTKRFYVNYPGLNQKWDEWVGAERLMKLTKENLQKVKATSEKQHPLENSTKDGLHLKSSNVTSGKKRKTMSKEALVSELATSVTTVVEEGLEAQAGEGVTTLHVDHAVTHGFGEQGPPNESMAMDNLKRPMNETLGSVLLPLKQDPQLLEPHVSNVGLVGLPVVSDGVGGGSKAGVGVSEPTDCFIPGWGLTNDANLLEPDKALDFITHALPPGTKATLSAMSQREIVKGFRCTAVVNLLLMTEAAKRLETFEAKEIELKEELTRCKATMTSQAKDIGIAAEVAVRLRKELKEVQVEMADAIKEASRAESARAQAETETSALRAGRLELLGRVSEAEGAKMRAEDEAAALKAEIAELLKKLTETEAAKKHVDEAARTQAETETSALRAGRLKLFGRVSEAEDAKIRVEDGAAAPKAENAELLKKLAEAKATKKHADEPLVVADETEKRLIQEVKPTREVPRQRSRNNSHMEASQRLLDMACASVE